MGERRNRAGFGDIAALIKSAPRFGQHVAGKTARTILSELRNAGHASDNGHGGGWFSE